MRLRIIAGAALALTLAGGTAAARPLVVILADARGTEAPDLLAPYAILAESGAVDVQVVSATAQPVRLTKGYAWVAPQMTLAGLAAGGRAPDVVIVPAMTVVDDPARNAWLRTQLAGGARVMSICNGAKVLAAAGLLDGRQATIHWWSRGAMRKAHPKVTWRQDRRWIHDGPVTTTAGISAGEPASLDLVRRLAGEDVMRQTARRLNLALPDPRHRGADYRLTAGAAGMVVGNSMAVWGREAVAVPIAPGFDELAFGDALDAWSRTFRSTAWAAGPAAARSRHGLTVYRAKTPPDRFDRRAPLRAAGDTSGVFGDVQRAYGASTARFVAVQFEHPWGVR